MSSTTYSLAQLGWRPFYSQQLTLEDLTAAFPARVAEVQRNLLTVLADSGEYRVTPPQRLLSDVSSIITVGDWLLVDRHTTQVARLLERQSLIGRRAAGGEHEAQCIAANVNTLFLVTSCNAEFSPSRLERYLAVAYDAGVTPVIVLSKADLCTDQHAFISAAARSSRDVAVVALNATDAAGTSTALSPWLRVAQTLAFVGSSGVGKSTLLNALLGENRQQTQGIRHADDKGRHTTTSRSLLAGPGGSWLIDTPGMRELKIGAVPLGLGRTFSDVESLAATCRYRDCSHGHETGCAVRSAIDAGSLDARRLTSYLKLMREAARAAAPAWKQRQNQRQFGRMAREAQRRRRKDSGRE